MPVCGRLFERKEMLANIKQPLFRTTQERQNNRQPFRKGDAPWTSRILFRYQIAKMASKCRSCMMLYVYMWCIERVMVCLNLGIESH